MRWQTTAVLAVILVSLGAFYYVYEIRLGPEREKTEARKGRVFAAEMGDVTAVEVKRGAEVLKFQREGEGWRMLAPVPTRADRAAVDELITAVVTAKADREISANPASLAEYGLDSPQADLTLTLKDGKQLGLQLGAKNPTAVWVYGRERESPRCWPYRMACCATPRVPSPTIGTRRCSRSTGARSRASISPRRTRPSGSSRPMGSGP